VAHESQAQARPDARNASGLIYYFDVIDEMITRSRPLSGAYIAGGSAMHTLDVQTIDSDWQQLLVRYASLYCMDGRIERARIAED
jgi:hypothetical protein